MTFTVPSKLTLTSDSISWITIVTKTADLALKAMCVVETVEASASGHVTDWPQGWVHIAIALTRGAATNLEESKQ